MFKHSKDFIKNLEKCNNCYMLGVLANVTDILPSNGEDNKPVTIRKRGTDVIFYVKAISDDPNPIVLLDKELANKGLSDVYIGSDTYDFYAELPEGYNKISNLNERIGVLENLLKGNVILFKPKITVNNNREIITKNITVLNIEKKVKPSDFNRFIPIPQVNMPNEEFERKLLNKEVITLKDYPNIMEMPEYIICNDYIYSNFEEDSLMPYANDIDWVCTKPNKIKKTKIDIFSDELIEKMVVASDNLVFIDKKYLLENIDNKISMEGLTLKEMVEVKESNTDKKKQNIKKDDLEIKFLKVLRHLALKNNLCYNHKDLINFHISIKTNPITILSGMSGIGKTQLALTYAEALGLSVDKGNLLIIPISPSYTEPMDVLGFINNTTGLYIPSETGLVDFLVRASKKEDEMHLVIFDEMNLSQVEHWFAPFLSLLELSPEKRVLELYSEQLVCHNRRDYPPKIKIGKNIRFIGTVNMDETTKSFSDRLLDRANIITPKKMSFVELRKEIKEFNIHSSVKIENIDKLRETFKKTDVFTKWINDKHYLDAFTDDELIFMDKLHNLLQKYDVQKGISFRLLEKIGDYLNNIPYEQEDTPLLSKNEAIDIQIKQRLMTKIRGAREQFGELIGILSNNEDELVNSELYNFFTSEDAKKISEFKNTINEIRRKARELYIYDYAN